jgi:hypothetical protein
MKQLKNIKLTILIGMMIPIFSFGQVRPDINSFTSAQRMELANLIIDFINPEIIKIHCDYTNHMAVGQNDYDIHDNFNFLPFHRTYLERLEDWLIEQGYPQYVPLPKWDGTTVPPIEFSTAGGTGNPPGNGVSTECSNVSSCSNAGTSCATPSDWNSTVTMPNILKLPVVTGDNNDLCDLKFFPSTYTSANDNSFTDGLSHTIEGATPSNTHNTNWHNSGHINLGGIMLNFRSPAAAIFWLWHAAVDDKWKEWECNCTNQTSNTTSPVDLYMKDNENVVEYYRDRGEEPNIDNGPMSLSQDMWVRQQQDGFTNNAHENAEFYTTPGLSNYVYVRVRNRGCVNSTVSANSTLKLYWVKSTTGVSWPTSFDGSLSTSGGSPLGGLIGSAVIPSIDAGGSAMLEFQWNPVDPSNYPQVGGYAPTDFCLLARIESNVDPMTFPETTQHWVNVKNNNNIIWKNIVILDADPTNFTAGGGGSSGATGRHYGSVYVSNPTSETVSFDMHFLADLNPEIVNYSDITVSMTQELWNIWQEGGAILKGDFKDVSIDDDVKKIQILSPETILKNITMPSGGLYPIAIEFNFHSDDFANLLPEYQYRIQQRYSNTNQIMGTETYIVRTGNRTPINADAGSDRLISDGESTDLSATDIGVPAIYNWYDQGGNLIYSGKDLSVSPELTKKYKLEVIATLDGVMDFDEVEIRVKQFEIISMSPNPSSDNVNIEYKANNASSAYLMVMMPYGNSYNYILDVNQNQTSINVSGFQTGIYNVILVCDGQVFDASTLVVQ